MKLSSANLAIQPPPITEVKSWLAELALPSDQPLIDLCQDIAIVCSFGYNSREFRDKPSTDVFDGERKFTVPIKAHFNRRVAAMLIAALTFTLGGITPIKAFAKDDEHRVRYYGWIEQMPETLHGAWHIGGHVWTTDAQTEFDQTDGPLAVGNCAKVDLRNGRVHEIDSEPVSDCR